MLQLSVRRRLDVRPVGGETAESVRQVPLHLAAATLVA